MRLKIGLPAKGRLCEQALDWLRSRQVTIERPDSGRRYSARATGAISAELIFMSAAEIPGELWQGALHLGITGSDLVHENLPDWQDRLELLLELGFGGARLVVAVPAFWVDVDSVEDLDEVAAQFRARQGRSLRIATKFHNLAREFLRSSGLTDYRLVDSQGATEGAVANNMAEAIVDLVSTGETLTANGLKPLDDGVVFQSQAVLLQSGSARFGSAERRAVASLVGGLPPTGTR